MNLEFHNSLLHKYTPNVNSVGKALNPFQDGTHSLTTIMQSGMCGE